MDLWVQPLSGSRPRGDPIRLTDEPGNEVVPVFSPDGRWIAYGRVLGERRDIYIIPASGGRPMPFSDGSVHPHASHLVTGRVTAGVRFEPQRRGPHLGRRGEGRRTRWRGAASDFGRGLRPPARLVARRRRPSRSSAPRERRPRSGASRPMVARLPRRLTQGADARFVRWDVATALAPRERHVGDAHGQPERLALSTGETTAFEPQMIWVTRTPWATSTSPPTGYCWPSFATTSEETCGCWRSAAVRSDRTTRGGEHAAKKTMVLKAKNVSTRFVTSRRWRTTSRRPSCQRAVLPPRTGSRERKPLSPLGPGYFGEGCAIDVTEIPAGRGTATMDGRMPPRARLHGKVTSRIRTALRVAGVTARKRVMRPRVPGRPAVHRLGCVTVILTATCNLRCAYCYQDRKQPRRMGWETLRRAVDLLLGSRRRDLELWFGGGEPLLEFPLLRRAVGYAEAACPPAKRLRFGLSTNGLLLDDDRADFLAAHRFSMQAQLRRSPARPRLCEPRGASARSTRGSGACVVATRRCSPTGSRWRSP